MMKTAEELLSKGEMQDAKHNFQSAYDRWGRTLCLVKSCMHEYVKWRTKYSVAVITL